MRNAGLEEAQAGIKIAGRNINSLRYVVACMHAKSLQLCPTLCNPVDHSPPGSSVHRILCATTLEWVAISFYRGSSWPRNQTLISYISCIGMWVLTTSTIWEAWFAVDTTQMADSEEELKDLRMKVKEESKKSCLKLNIQKAKIMASGPITSWQIDGEKMKTVADFIFLGSKITADCNRSHEIERRLLFGRKAMTNLDSVLKNKDIIWQQRSI